MNAYGPETRLKTWATAPSTSHLEDDSGIILLYELVVEFPRFSIPAKNRARERILQRLSDNALPTKREH
ncbi:MAG: hypothetical protein Q9184_002734 [Pyrenodesmia sp. 2 TL-2023]